MPVTWLPLLVPLVCLFGVLAGRSLALYEERRFLTGEQRLLAATASVPRFHRVRYHEPRQTVNDGGRSGAEAFGLGLLLEAKGDVVGAEAAYRRADSHGHAGAAANLGVLLEQRGLPFDAQAAYRRADERDDPKGALNLGMLLEERGDLHAAREAYRRADQYGRGSAQVAESAIGISRDARDA